MMSAGFRAPTPSGPVHQPGFTLALEHTPDPDRRTSGAPQPPLSALNSVRHAASTSRTCGRFAVDPFGPIPYPDALPGAAQQQAEETVRKIHHKNSRLTRPAPAPKIPTTSSGDVSFPRLYGDLEAERFELSDRATTLLFLGVAAQRGGAGIVVERTVR